MTSCLVVDAPDAAISASQLAQLHDPEFGRAVVVADPDRKALTILQDILLGIGPDRDGRGWPKAQSSAREWVGAWLLGHQITELVVAHADLLMREQLDEMVDLARGATRVWLLARRPLRPELLKHRERSAHHRADYRIATVTVDTFITHFELEREIPTRLPQNLSRFPRVPLAGMLRFRQGCHRMLSQEEFRLVDSLLYRSCNDAEERLDRHRLDKDETWALVEPILAQHYPADATITVLRGYQLAAFARDLHFAFDGALVHAQLAARSICDTRTAHLLTADADPSSAVMLVGDGMGFSPQGLARLGLDALDPDGRHVRYGNDVRNVPPAVAPLLATHYHARLRQVDGMPPETVRLFGHEREPLRPLAAQTIRNRIETAARRLGSARSNHLRFTPDQFSLTRFGWS